MHQSFAAIAHLWPENSRNIDFFALQSPGICHTLRGVRGHVLCQNISQAPGGQRLQMTGALQAEWKTEQADLISILYVYSASMKSYQY